MNEPKQKQYLFDNPRNVTLLVRTLYLVCFLLVVLDFVVHRHTTHDWDQLPGFYAIYGFLAYVVIVVGAQQLRRLVMRKEDYYDVDE